MIRLALLLLAALVALPAQAADKFTVMLDWFVNPDHAPIIAAAQRGCFRGAGRDVTILAPADPADPPRTVAAGQVDLAVGRRPQLDLRQDPACHWCGSAR